MDTAESGYLPANFVQKYFGMLAANTEVSLPQTEFEPYFYVAGIRCTLERL